MATGTIRTINPDRGYGFIEPSHGPPNIFFHIRDSHFRNDDFGPHLVLMDVTYEATTDVRSGKPQAVNVRSAR